LINAVKFKLRLPRVETWFWLAILLVGALLLALPAADLKETQQYFFAGDYTNCIRSAEQGGRVHPDDDDWVLLLSKALMETGQYPQALSIITNALEHDTFSLRLRWQAREVFEANGQTSEASEMVDKITRMVAAQPRAYHDAPSLVVFGQAVLLRGADPKRVMDTLFDAAKKADPGLRDTYLARGALALEKHDFALAAKTFEEGLKQAPDDPDLHFGLAKAYAPSDTALMVSSIEAALQRNSNHVGCLLLLVDHSIDAEDYSQAESLLDQIKAFNPVHPDAWAYRAVIAHLENHPELEKAARETALKFWSSNPHVDHLIGLKLSQNYRFSEGAAHQKQALQFASDYLPAKAQLAQDLLRLGDEAEGWKLADEAQKADAYDVTLFNLTTLHDKMEHFEALTNSDFTLRMGAHEAALYGQRALALLSEAKSNVCAKYEFELPRPTIVEIFPEQKDFAVRTFGMPGNPGYLGVCFGSLITANSPAAHPGHPVNWQAVLWHECCHVVTLQLTHNKMPRWLSEGISVYEESQANPAWGQRMNPHFREMVLGNDLTPVSKLSAAFLAPRSEMHLQFAYYESSLVVEFIVNHFGMQHLKTLLKDLGEGMPINSALERNTTPMQQLETDFAAFAKERALQLAPGLDWEKPSLSELSEDIGSANALSFSRHSKTNHGGSLLKNLLPPPRDESESPETAKDPSSEESPTGARSKWMSAHPTNFYALTEQAQTLLEEKKYEAAKTPLQKLAELYPDATGPDCAYAMLAQVHHELGETNAEREVLKRFARQDDEAKDAYVRLMELEAVVQDWAGVVENANRDLAVDPLSPPPYRFLALASEHTEKVDTAIGAYRSLLQLDPPDPAQIHFQLAKALHVKKDPAAKREVLQALEEAPRFRAALELLLELSPTPSGATNSPTALEPNS
jgi:tetratricopeptide (TPR) repeat protein